MSEQISPEERYLKFKQMIAELMEISAPYQNARDELAKTLISLSSAAVVLMITFGKPFAVVSPNWFWRSLPYVSWVAFLVTIIVCIITLWLSITVRGIGIRLFNERVNIIRAIANPNHANPQPYQTVDDLIGKVTNPNKKDSWAHFCVKLGLAFFALALMSLGAIGWWQLA